MNAPEVATAALDMPAMEVSLWGMFWAAHLVVKIVMLGLLLASVWCWAIIINKTILFARIRRSMNRFEQVFWSGQSLEDLYRTLAERQSTGMAALFVAAMREWKRSFETCLLVLHGPACPHREGAERLHPARGRAPREPAPGARHRGVGRPVRRPVRHGLGHHDVVPLDRGLEEHVAGGRGARHCRGSVRHRDRPLRRHPGARLLQQAAGQVAKTQAGSKASPTSSRRSCRGRSTSTSRPSATVRPEPRRVWRRDGDDGRRGRAGTRAARRAALRAPWPRST